MAKAPTKYELRNSKAPVTVGMLTVAMDAVIAAMRERDAKIKALEARPVMNYRGVWNPDDDYQPGDLVTHGGSMHYCWEPTRGNRPGETDAWQLCVKRGAR